MSSAAAAAASPVAVAAPTVVVQPLATVERIVKLEPIAGADRIEMATVLGWETVVKKGDFSVGDLCVWHMPDTVLPAECARYKFLERDHYRLKCSKIRGVYSQGLALPLDQVLEDCIGRDVSAQVHSEPAKTHLRESSVCDPDNPGAIVLRLAVKDFATAFPYIMCSVCDGVDVRGITLDDGSRALGSDSDFAGLAPDTRHFCVVFDGLFAIRHWHVFREGTDVTTLVGIRKYSKPEPRHPGPRVGGTAERPSTFPTDLVPRTEEPSVQTVGGMLRLLNKLPPSELYAALKLDGTSFTVFSTGETEASRSGICSRNYLLDPLDAAANASSFFSGKTVTSPYHTIAQRYKLPISLASYCAGNMCDLAVQGEIVGHKINDDPMGLGEGVIEFYVFNVFDIGEQRYLGLAEMQHVCSALGLKMVPRITPPEGFSAMTSKQWLEFADTLKYANGKPAEGLVLRPCTGTLAGSSRISCKVVSRRYLLAKGE